MSIKKETVKNKKLRIGINAQIELGSGTGGIETVLRVLTSLVQLEGEEEYIFISHPAGSNWLKPLLNERQKLVVPPPPQNSHHSGISKNVRSFLGPLRPLARQVKQFFAPPKTAVRLPVSDGFYESLGCDVIHFPYQDYVDCKIPTVYNPHDLQHLHYPNFFSGEEVSRREIIYPDACRAAKMVVVASEFVKQDVVEKYNIPSDKVQVIAWSPPPKKHLNMSGDEPELTLKKYNISPAPYMFYPAMTWEHKNHLRLLEAVALLRDRDNLTINLICSGHKNAFFGQIEGRLRELKLDEQVKFLGVVSYEELSSLYLRAQFVIIPTLFEAASAPLFEAWQHDVAVTCSAVTSLPEQAGNAALLFDPFSAEAIAGAIKKMSLDEDLRESLRERGTIRLRDFNLERTLKSYRAVYRKAAGLKLNDEDRELLDNGNLSSTIRTRQI